MIISSILDSLYHGNHDIEFTEAIKLLFNMSHWLNRNYVIAGNFKYDVTSKTNGNAFYSFKTGKRQEFQLVFFLDKLADGGLVMDMADHDFVAPIKNQAYSRTRRRTSIRSFFLIIFLLL